MLGISYIFVFYAVCFDMSLLLTFWVGNTSLKAPNASTDEEAGTSRDSTDAEGLQESVFARSAHSPSHDGLCHNSDDEKKQQL